MGTKAGDLVVIRRNPHHAAAIDILGRVVRYRPNAGPIGTDLVDVEYQDSTGEAHVMPFAAQCLRSGSPAVLRALAEHHEAVAAELRDAARAAEAKR